MPEQIDLTTPVVPPTITNYKVASLLLNWTGRRIVIELTGPAGEHMLFNYEGQAALDLMIALNKANLTSNSLQKRIFTQLIADGKISGTVSGSPA